MFVATEATILHADLDAFYASVEQRDDPRLRGRPVIVGAGVVLAASYEAKAFGVRTAMGGAQARRLCPHAAVEPRMSAYAEASKAVFEVFETDHAAGRRSLDRRGVPRRRRSGRISGAPIEIAVRLRRDVLERVGLPITVGVARTKFLAKVASGVAKPDGLLVVPPDGELASSTRFRWSGCGASGRSPPASSAAGCHDRRRGSRSSPRRRSSRCSGRRPAATCTPWRTIATPGRYRSAAGGARSARSARSAAGRGRPTTSTPSWSRSSTASPAGCGLPGESAAPSCSAALR